MHLTDFKALTFDCYGTLIDWESGIFAALQPLLSTADTELGRDAALEAFARFESEQQRATPEILYPNLLSTVHGKLARHWGLASNAELDKRFGRSVPDWPAFADSIAALTYLEQHYELVILSNVDRESFAASNEKLGVSFAAIFTAQDIGSYKPNPRNFEYLISHLAERGIEKSDILHTAQSLFHDHAPATQLELATNWIDRRHDKEGFGATAPPPTEIQVDFRFPSMAAFVQAHEQDVKCA